MANGSIKSTSKLGQLAYDSLESTLFPGDKTKVEALESLLHLLAY